MDPSLANFAKSANYQLLVWRAWSASINYWVNKQPSGEVCASGIFETISVWCTAKSRRHPMTENKAQQPADCWYWRPFGGLGGSSAQCCGQISKHWKKAPCINKLYLCLHWRRLVSLCVLTAIFYRWTWVSGCLLKQRMMEMVVTTGSISLAKLQ